MILATERYRCKNSSGKPDFEKCFIICLSSVLAKTEFPHQYVSLVSHISAQSSQDVRRRKKKFRKKLMVPKMGGRRRRRRSRYPGSVCPCNWWSGKHEFGQPFAEKDKEPHIPNPQKLNRRQGPPSEHPGPREGIQQEARRQKSFIQPKTILNSSCGWQHLNSRQKILL